MKKKLVSILLCTAMAVSVLAGCGEKSTEQSDTEQKENSEVGVDSEESSIVNKEGYPIVNEPVTLTVGVLAPQADYETELGELEWIKNIEEISGVTLEFEYYANEEAVNLMFASRDYPDIAIKINATDRQVEEAAAAGDLYAFDEMMDEWAPNWATYLEENSYYKKIVTSSDGHIYGIPCIIDDPSMTGLRDQWFIKKAWLDELGLEIPTTVDEFYNVLKAFKDNAGTGTIPEDVIPWSVYNVCTNQNGSPLELFASYGIFLVGTDNGYMVTVDDNGQVEFNWTSEAMKEPMEFIHKCVEEGLIPADLLTADYPTWSAKTAVADTLAGSYSAYYNHEEPGQERVVPMDLLDTGNDPVLRVQTNAVRKNAMLIFKNCEYPEVAMRLVDLMGDEEISAQAYFGTIGDTYLQKNDDGSYTLLDYESNDVYSVSPRVNAPMLVSSDIFENLTITEGTDEYYRVEALNELYGQYTVDIENMFPPITASEKNKDRLAELQTDIKTYVEKTYNTWALEGGIEEGWDDYIAQLEAYGLSEYLSLLQEELDAFNAK